MSGYLRISSGLSLCCLDSCCLDVRQGVLLLWYSIGRTLSPAMRLCIRLPVTTQHNIQGDIPAFKALDTCSFLIRAYRGRIV